MNIQEAFEKLSSLRSTNTSTMNGSSLNTWYEKLKFNLSPTQRAEFYEMIASLVQDGKPLDASVRELRNRYSAKKRPLACLLGIWLGSLDEGKSFADAIRGYASDTEVVIIATTEKSGEPASGFTQAAGVARASATIRATLMAEMSIPIIQIILLMVLLIGFSISLAPQLLQSVPLAAMDDSQRSLFALSSVIAKTWYFVIPVGLVFFYVIMWSLPRYTGRFRSILDRFPPWSLYRIYSSATFMISLSALIKAGVPIETAIRFIRQQSSPWLREHLSIMIGRMRAGVEQGDAIDTGLLSPRLADMVAIYSKTTKFDAAVSSAGKISMDDGLVNIKNQAGIAKYISMILIGVFVGWILTSVMGIGDAAKRAGNMTQQGQKLLKK